MAELNKRLATIAETCERVLGCSITLDPLQVAIGISAAETYLHIDSKTVAHKTPPRPADPETNAGSAVPYGSTTSPGALVSLQTPFRSTSLSTHDLGSKGERSPRGLVRISGCGPCNSPTRWVDGVNAVGP